MSHIEFIGIAGVGKSTIHLELVESDFLYGGKDKHGVKRLYPRIQTFLDHLPSRLETKLDTFLWQIISEQYIDDLLRNNKELEQILTKEIYNFVDKDIKGLRRYMNNSMSKYQFGVSTKHSHEILCLDEGFYHRAASLGVRTNCVDGFECPGNWYFETIPDPDILVYIDAPNKIIQKRKIQRDGQNYASEELKNIRNLINEVCKHARTQGVQVLEINNERCVNKAVNDILAEFH